MARKKTVDTQFKYLMPTFKLYDIKDKQTSLNDIIYRFLDRIQSMVVIDGLPDTMPKFDILRMLQTNGFIVVSEVDGCLYANIGGLGGIPNAYYQPTVCIVNNPYLNYNKEIIIQDDKDGVWIKHDSYYRGLIPLLEKYATFLVENEITLRNVIINARNQDFIVAPDSNTAKSGQIYLDKLENGDITVISENSFLDGLQVKARSQGQANTITQLIEMENYLTSKFFEELGLRDNDNMKREYISNDETVKGDSTLTPLIDDIVNNIRDGFERVNKKYGCNITVSLGDAWKDVKESQQETQDQQDQQDQDNGGDE